MHIKSEKAKKATKHTLYLTQELTENAQRPINKAQKVMTIHIINNVRARRSMEKLVFLPENVSRLGGCDRV